MLRAFIIECKCEFVPFRIRTFFSEFILILISGVNFKHIADVSARNR